MRTYFTRLKKFYSVGYSLKTKKGKISHMQHKPRYKLMRRILFPYSGEEPLSLKQGLRVMLAWILFFPLCISLLTLVFVMFGSFPLQRMPDLLAFACISMA